MAKEEVKEAAEAFPNNTAYVFNDDRISYEQYYTQITKFAAALHSLGIKSGEKTAIFLPNIPAYLISYFAVNRIGESSFLVMQHIARKK